jgi:hypothetical protein
MDKVERVNQYINIAYNAIQIAEQTGIKRDELSKYYMDALRVPLSLRFTDEEMAQQAEQVREYMNQLQAQQAVLQQQQTMTDNEGA